MDKERLGGAGIASSSSSASTAAKITAPETGAQAASPVLDVALTCPTCTFVNTTKPEDGMCTMCSNPLVVELSSDSENGDGERPTGGQLSTSKPSGRHAAPLNLQGQGGRPADDSLAEASPSPPKLSSLPVQRTTALSAAQAPKLSSLPVQRTTALSAAQAPKLSSLLVQRTPAPSADTRPSFPAPDGQYWAWVDTGVAGMGWALCTGRPASASASAAAAPSAPPGAMQGAPQRTPQGTPRGTPQGAPQRAQRGEFRSVASVGYDSDFDCAGRGLDNFFDDKLQIFQKPNPHENARGATMGVVLLTDAEKALRRAAARAFDLLRTGEGVPPVMRVSRSQLKMHFHISNGGLDKILSRLGLATTATESFSAVDALQIVHARSEFLNAKADTPGLI